MGKRENFTADRVSKFQCEPGKQQSIFWDGKAPGLGLRVTAKGAKSYIFETRLHGKTLRYTIGDVRTWSIGKAQDEATRLKTLTDQGIDPREQMAEKRAKAEAARAEAKRKDLTLSDVWKVYIEVRKPKWGERSYRDHVVLAAPGGEQRKRGAGLTVAGPLAALMPLLLSELTGPKIAEWLEAETATRPTGAAHAYRLLRAFIRWAADMPEYQATIPPNAYSARIVKDALPKSHAKEGDSLQREQLPSWFAATRSIRNPVISAYLQALLLTGARREEMAGLRWEDVDFKWRSITIRDKIEESRIIPLTPYLANLLSGLKTLNETPPPQFRILQGKRVENDLENWEPSPWVFFSKTSASGRIAEPRVAHVEALAAAGLPHVSIHGLRRSFGTLCEWVEMPSGISAQIMGHKPSALAEKHYRRRPLDLLRMWHDKIEAWMLEQAGVKFEAAKQSKGPQVVKTNTAA